MDKIETPANARLRDKIGWLCHVLRLTAAAYALWVLIELARFWSTPARVARHWSDWLHVGVTEPWPGQLALGFTLHLAIWLLVAAACYSVWRLFSGYLEGRIFTADAAVWLRRAGTYGLAAQFSDMLTRPIVSMIVTAHMQTGDRLVSVSLSQPDLLNILFLTGFIALAHIFGAAAKLAEEHAQIV